MTTPEPTREQCIEWLEQNVAASAPHVGANDYHPTTHAMLRAILRALRSPVGGPDDRELLETLSDARAQFEKDYAWEKQSIGNGGSTIAMGQARRYADAIAVAALRLTRAEPLSAQMVEALDELSMAMERLADIKDTIDRIENRCMAADGPVTNTRHEMSDEELRQIYRLAGGVIQP